MTRSEYFRRAQEAYDSGRVSVEAYDCMIMNADEFCDEEENKSALPRTYAEMEYKDFENAEAIEGAKWDDKNYLHYMER